jgi:hypothetical protein
MEKRMAQRKEEAVQALCDLCWGSQMPSPPSRPHAPDRTTSTTAGVGSSPGVGRLLAIRIRR